MFESTYVLTHSPVVSPHTYSFETPRCRMISSKLVLMNPEFSCLVMTVSVGSGKTYGWGATPGAPMASGDLEFFDKCLKGHQFMVK